MAKFSVKSRDVVYDLVASADLSEPSSRVVYRKIDSCGYIGPSLVVT